MQSPVVGLAAIAYTLCDPRAPYSSALNNMLHNTLGIRGPRNAAIGKIASAKITYDNMKAKLKLVESKPYGDSVGGSYHLYTIGGVVKSVKREDDKLVVTVGATTMKVANECIKSHRTNKIAQVRSDGTVLYEDHCDKIGTVTHDNTRPPLKLRTRYAPWLKPGVVFSGDDNDVIAVWPSASAKTPSMVLGAKLK
jgi:hypothetical protein